MPALLRILAAVLGSIILYLLLFAFAASKPLTIGFYHRLFETKAAYARSIRVPKIIVMAGSNGFYSVRCETIQQIVQRPCVNLSVIVALGTTIMLAQLRQLALPGDLVLLPFEYRLYRDNPGDSAIDAPYTFTEDHRIFLELPWRQQIEYAFSFDFHYLMASIVENIEWLWVKRSENYYFEDAQGDRIGHGRAVRSHLTTDPSSANAINDFDPRGPEAHELREFFAWAKRNDVLVVGTLPASINTIPISGNAVDRLAKLYELNGEKFLTLRDKSQYPLDCFFDTNEHLVEECQIEHSRLLGQELKKIIDSLNST